MSDAPDQLLVLWDIDGTLLARASVEHARALYAAIERVHGVDVTGVRGVSAAGRTDGAIARDLLRGAGVDDAAISAGFDAVAAACAEAYAPGDLSGHVVPGIGELLSDLAGQGGVRNTLVTGNFEAVAHAKLGAAGLGRHFERGQGGFGSDAEDRALLPAIARARALGGARGGDGDGAGGTDGWPRARTVVVGDTPNDIACARADGVAVIAVTTGNSPAGDLAAADDIAADTDQLRALLEARRRAR